MNAAYWSRVWEILTWKRWAIATGLGVLIALLVRLQNLYINFYFIHWRMLYDTPFYVAFAWAFLVAIACAEASVPRGKSPSLWRYSFGALAASLVCVGLALSFSEQFRLAPKRVIYGGSRVTLQTFSPHHRRTIVVFEVGFDGVVHGWLATFIYVGLRRARHATRALSDAEVARSEAQRALVASQLLAAHAQLDPDFVMRRLDTIEGTYEADPAAADRQLDELIAFLRDAIPRWRSDRAPQPQG